MISRLFLIKNNNKLLKNNNLLLFFGLNCSIIKVLIKDRKELRYERKQV